MDTEFTLEELVRRSGLSLRTVRFYMQEGLLPGPDSRGKNARYTQKHLDRLELIQRLKNLYLPLQQIYHIVNNMTEEEIELLLKSQNQLHTNSPSSASQIAEIDHSSTPGKSALEYIQSLEEKQSNLQGFSNSRKPSLERKNSAAPDLFDKQNYSSTTKNSNLPQTWKRIVLEEGLELHYRDPITSEESQRIDRLITLVQQIFAKK